MHISPYFDFYVFGTVYKYVWKVQCKNLSYVVNLFLLIYVMKHEMLLQRRVYIDVLSVQQPLNSRYLVQPFIAVLYWSKFYSFIWITRRFTYSIKKYSDTDINNAENLIFLNIFCNTSCFIYITTVYVGSYFFWSDI